MALGIETTAGDALNDHITKMQQEVAAYLVPDSGVSEHAILNRLIELLDGPEQRYIQMRWNRDRGGR